MKTKTLSKEIPAFNVKIEINAGQEKEYKQRLATGKKEFDVVATWLIAKVTGKHGWLDTVPNRIFLLQARPDLLKEILIESGVGFPSPAKEPKPK